MSAPDGFAPHPEGGSFLETWRSHARVPRNRDTVTAIGFHLEPGERSRWHRVHGASELWVWNGGARLRLRLGGDGAAPDQTAEVVLGPGGQHLVAPGEWQAAAPVGGAVTVACVVSPGFDFADLELWDGEDPGESAIPRILLVCEGNLCRSPTAELLLRHELETRGVPAEVSSAGLRTEPGLPMERHAVAAVRKVAPVDTDRFRTTPFSEANADLILTATVAQRDAVDELVPEARDRTFSWLELLALAELAPLEPGTLVGLTAQLRARRGLVHGDYDVRDPIGRSGRTFDKTAASIATAMARLADLLARTA